MDYKETINWLFAQLPMYQRIGKAAYKSDLQTTIDLLNQLNNPQNSFKAIHIAGTNGKGSVSHIVASILQEAGYKIGLYTSPHLKDFRERIRLDGQLIPEEDVVAFVEDNSEVLEKIKPSFFEMTVAMAYDYFAKQDVDFAVLETGMGGRLDSTNICNPVITAITNIGLDHQQFLGENLETIAREKAGIIKENVPLLVGRKQKETTDIFVNKAKSMRAELIFAEDEVDIKTIETSTIQTRSFDVWYKNKLFLENAESLLMADYQNENIATAICIVQELLAEGVHLNNDNFSNGLKNLHENTGLQGRWQIIGKNPLTICDTGHNIDGIKAVVRQIKKTSFKHLHFVFGMVNDKNPESILYLLPQNANYYFCRPNIPRGMDEEELSKHAFKAGLNGQTYSSVREAFNIATNNADIDDLIFVGGSTFVVAEIV